MVHSDDLLFHFFDDEIYLNYGLTPVSRFCAYQHVHFAIDPDMKVEFLDTLSEKKPQWILAFCSGETKIPEVQSLIEIQYQYKFDQSDFYSYLEYFLIVLILEDY